MSRILKRPMFMKGGSAGGIMHMANPRKKYQEGTQLEDFMQKNPLMGEDYQRNLDLYRMAGGQDEAQLRNDALSNLLIQGGLNLVSGTGAGKGTLGSIAESFKDPAKTAMAEYSKMKGGDRELRLASLKNTLEQDAARKKAAAELQAKMVGKSYESGTPQSQTKDYVNSLSDLASKAVTQSQRAGAQKTLDVAYQVFPQIEQGFRSGVGITIAPTSTKEELREWVQGQAENTRFIDPISRKWKMVMTNPETGKKDIILIDQNTLTVPE